MSRSKRFAYSLVSSYAAIGVNVVYTLASVPLALHYLDKAEFGIWALVTQLGGYLMLLEFGMTGSVARSLSDHKDDMSDGMYGSILRTGSRVFAIQGATVLLIGGALAWLLPALLDLPPERHRIFTNLMLIQALMSAIKISAGAIAAPLWCHQRLDISNLTSSLSLVLSYFALWVGFANGWGLYSLAGAVGIGTLFSMALLWSSCRILGLYPPKSCRGSYDSAVFRDLFGFGRDLFIMNVGAQLANASQVIIISRILGVEAAAVWAVATKIYNMAILLVVKIFESSAGGLAEMVVRGELTLLRKRFQDIVLLSVAIAVAAGSGIALINGPFIEMWTSGKVTWPLWNNLLLGCLLVTVGTTRCHINLVGISKDIRGMKYVYLIEGLAFVIFSLVLGTKFGLTGILIAALGCNILVSGTYGVARTAAYFGLSARIVAFWPLRACATLAVTLLSFLLLSSPFFTSMPPLHRTLYSSAIFFGTVLPSLWFISLDPSIRQGVLNLGKRLFQNTLACVRPS